MVLQLRGVTGNANLTIAGPSVERHARGFLEAYDPGDQSSRADNLTDAPNVGRDLLRFGQPEHVRRWRVSLSAVGPFA